MKEKLYPREISFDSPLRNIKEEEPAYDYIKKVVDNTHMYQLDENIIKIIYPSDLVKEIRTVNVDDCIFRLDFKYREEHFLYESFFPNCGYNSENFFKNRRFYNSERIEETGKLTLIYPQLRKLNPLFGV